jgi:hypothetical protein
LDCDRNHQPNQTAARVPDEITASEDLPTRFKLDGSQLDVLCHATATVPWIPAPPFKPAARYMSPVAAQHIESAYKWSRQPKGLLGDELGYELSPPGQNKQENIHAETFNDQPNT